MSDSEFVDVVCTDKQHKNCPIKLSTVYCDGYKKKSEIGVFSHFHHDHISSITECIGDCDVLITHPITFQAIIATKPGFALREQWTPQEYGDTYVGKFADITLLKANHIPGSSQVYVESNGKSLLYSGDFSYPGISIRHADYLVLDATHGDPWYDGKTDRKSVMNRMFEEIKEKMFSDKSIIIRSASGTMQELIWYFEVGYDGSKLSHDIPFVMPKKQKDVLLKIFANDKKEFRDNIIEYESHDFWNLIYKNKKCVIFLTNEIVDYSLQNYYQIIIDRYRFVKEKAAILPFRGGCRYNLASHASVEDILTYVGKINPKIVVTDYSRSGHAPMLAKLIHSKFPEINAYPRPSNITHV